MRDCLIQVIQNDGGVRVGGLSGFGRDDAVVAWGWGQPIRCPLLRAVGEFSG